MAKEKIEPIYNDTFRRSRKHPRRIVWIILVLVIILAGAGYFWHVHRSSSLSTYPVRGAMITQDDGYVDFQQLKDSGLKFVYLKATSGARYKDDEFEDNYNRISGSGLETGIYHEFSFTSSAKEQYDYIVSQVKKESGTLPIAIHVTYYEGSRPNVKTQGKKLAQLMKMLASHYDQECIVWASPSIQKALVNPYVTHSKRMLTTTELTSKNTDVKFIQYVGKDKLEINKQTSNLLPAIYNGNVKSWKQYIN